MQLLELFDLPNLWISITKSQNLRLKIEEMFSFILK